MKNKKEKQKKNMYINGYGEKDQFNFPTKKINLVSGEEKLIRFYFRCIEKKKVNQVFFILVK